MPILGTVASSRLVVSATGAFEAIASYTVTSGGSGTVSFTSIPSTYTHLQIRAMVYSAGTNANLYHDINGTSVTWAHYSLQDGSATRTSESWGAFGIVYPQRATLRDFCFIMEILDYKDTNKFKVTRTQAGGPYTSTEGRLGFGSSYLATTSAVTSVSFYYNTGNIESGSVFSLYGIGETNA